MAALARRAVRSALALSALLLASATPCAAATADADGMEAEMARPDDALAASLTGDGFIAPDASHEAIPGRNQGPEKLTFLSTTLGSHMVLQRAPQQAVVWGFTAAGATVTTIICPSSCPFAGPPHNACTGGPSCASAQHLSCTAGADGTWRQKLPATAASKSAFDFTFSSSGPAAETATMTDVLFGDVYICGGQSNMEMSMAAVANAPVEKQEANAFPTIRFLSVGHRTASATPLRNLQSVWEPWQVASNTTINQNAAPGHTLFSTFSAVCWLFGKELSTRLGGVVPLGLISDNWGGTKVEVWVPSKSYEKCNRSGPAGAMYNAMVLPYAAGPMAISGFTWYQGEANTANATTAQQYACLFPQMITAWREALGAPAAWFGFVQLSTWCTLQPQSLPEMREAQMAALSLPNVGYATNADHGMGCTIHPAEKQYVGKRLAHSALAMVYKQNVSWRSPAYVSAAPAPATSMDSGSVGVVVSLADVGAEGLKTIYPFNYESASYGVSTNPRIVVDCTGTYPSAHGNSSMAEQCAWASLQLQGGMWLNATVAVQGGDKLLLSAKLPRQAATGSAADTAVVATAYGWGPIPMLSAVDTATGLPVLPWNRSIA